MSTSIHDFHNDLRNTEIKIWLNGQLKRRDEAMISVFDSGFVLGDGVWEGFRIVAGHPVFLDAHLDRLFEGAKAIALDIGMNKQELTHAIYDTIKANNMIDNVHVRLMVSRGIKRTPYQDPRACIGNATVVIVPEFKQPKPETLNAGLTLFTVHVRRGYPDVQDPKLNSHSKLNCITACIQATEAGADEALMLDPHGFVATCNSTHFFIVRKGEVWTSTGDYCLGGITRANVIDICRKNNIICHEKNFSLTQVYSADEAFCTGTFAGVVPIRKIDGRLIGNELPGPMAIRLQQLYRELVERDVMVRSGERLA